MTPRRSRPQTLRAIHPNAGLEVAYRKRIVAILERIHRSVIWWLSAEYRKHPPAALAMDANPFSWIMRVIRRLRRRWLGAIEEAAPKIAAHFDQAVSQRSDAALKTILRDAGISVRFQLTPAMADIRAASINENVALIKSIPSRYFDQIETIISQGYGNGFDLKRVTDDIQHQFGVSRKRAAFIARDQSSKLNSQYNKARYLESGFSEGIWMHSGGGRHPRPTHVKAGKDKVKFNLAEGWYDPDPRVKKKIQPGYLINCFPGDTLVKFADNTKKAFRYWFDGYLTEIVTETGETLRATFNHPVLTPNGWIAIGLLKEGDHLIQISQKSVMSVEQEYDSNNAVPSIADVFDAFRSSGPVEISLGADFHGDVVESNVDIVFPARPLRLGIEPDVPQGIVNLLFPNANLFTLSGGSNDKLFVGTLDAAHSRMGCFGQSLATDDALSLHPDLGGVTSVASRDIVASEYPTNNDSLVSAAVSFSNREFAFATNVGGDDSTLVDPAAASSGGPSTGPMGNFDATIPKMFADDIGPNSDNLGYFFESFPFRYKALRVVNNVRRRFSDHVYTLETASGWFAVSPAGIVTKNCRCTFRPVVPGLS